MKKKKLYINWIFQKFIGAAIGISGFLLIMFANMICGEITDCTIAIVAWIISAYLMITPKVIIKLFK